MKIRNRFQILGQTIKACGKHPTQALSLLKQINHVYKLKRKYDKGERKVLLTMYLEARELEAKGVKI